MPLVAESPVAVLWLRGWYTICVTTTASLVRVPILHLSFLYCTLELVLYIYLCLDVCLISGRNLLLGIFAWDTVVLDGWHGWLVHMIKSLKFPSLLKLSLNCCSVNGGEITSPILLTCEYHLIADLCLKIHGTVLWWTCLVLWRLPPLNIFHKKIHILTRACRRAPTIELEWFLLHQQLEVAFNNHPSLPTCKSRAIELFCSYW